MTPVVFDGCFGWLHPAAGNRGVVLCAPYGYEELCVHRQWAALANRIAASGLPTLRFDYRGTGDSIGSDEDPNRVRAWIDSVRDAVRWMRAEVGVTEVALVGLRLGGLLAAQAARELGDIDMLALLAPPVSGRAYGREMKAFAAFSPRPDDAPAPDPRTADDIEAGGFVLTAQTIADLKPIDLRRLDRAPARHVLLMPNPADSADMRLDTPMRALGADVQVVPFDEFGDFICEVIYGQRTPEAAFSALTAWLMRDAPAATEIREPRVVARIETPESIETPVFFGKGAQLVGVRCEPLPSAADPAAPAVVFINTGHHHHIGINRMAVTQGRRLAARGITSMRIDLAGLGDSPAWPGQPENELYNPASIDDIRAAIDCLETQGHRECVLVGLCSGAHLAYHTSLKDGRVAGQVLINLERFIWRKGYSDETVSRVNAKMADDLCKDVFQALGKTAKVRRLVLGGRPEWRAVKALVMRLHELSASFVGRVLKRLFGFEGEVSQSLRLLSTIGTRTLLVYSGGDSGLVELKIHNLDRDGDGLADHKNVRVEILNGADHSLTLRSSRAELARIVEEYIESGLRPAPETRPRLAAALRLARAA
jgi:pimeloyl-ACP methyl ester carboxylesterase